MTEIETAPRESGILPHQTSELDKAAGVDVDNFTEQERMAAKLAFIVSDSEMALRIGGGLMDVYILPGANLTEEQVAKIKKASRDAIDARFTPERRSQIDSESKSGETDYTEALSGPDDED